MCMVCLFECGHCCLDVEVLFYHHVGSRLSGTATRTFAAEWSHQPGSQFSNVTKDLWLIGYTKKWLQVSFILVLKNVF